MAEYGHCGAMAAGRVVPATEVAWQIYPQAGPGCRGYAGTAIRHQMRCRECWRLAATGGRPRRVWCALDAEGMGDYCLWPQFAQKWEPGDSAVPHAVQYSAVVPCVVDWACRSLPQLVQKRVPEAFAIWQRGQLIEPIWGIGR